MKKLKELIDCNYDIEIKGIKTNSQAVEENDLFICTNTGTMDRHLFIDDAIKRKAAAIIVSKNIEDKQIPLIKVDDTNKTFSEIIKKFYDYPLNEMNIIGVTGTDGKTTVATIISTLLGDDKCGYIGTNGISCKYFNKKTSNTTPNLDVLYPTFKSFLENNIKNIAIEVSSEAVKYRRVEGIEFDCSILTNITKEHLNTHKTLENYIACKCELFENTKKDGFCILNKDDEHFKEVLNKCNGKVLTYGTGDDNDLIIKNIILDIDKTKFTIIYNNKEYDITSPLIATFNVYNLAASLLALLALGHDINNLIDRIKDLKVSGRLQKIDLGQDYKVFVDYAHTPNGINNLLKFMNSIEHNRIIVVFSEPGERDKTKRPEKGYNVITNCDYAIVTSQDPRSEEPIDIVNDLLTLVKDKKNYEVIIDRSKAIKRAIEIAKKDDIILIIGKGNENYQILKDKIIEFSDVDEVIKHIKSYK